MEEPVSIIYKLPEELLIKITLYLPPRDIFIANKTCKTWHGLLYNSGCLFKKYTLDYLGMLDDEDEVLKVLRSYNIGSEDPDVEMQSDDSSEHAMANLQLDTPMDIFEKEAESSTFGNSYYDSVENCINVLKTVTHDTKVPLAVEGYRTDGGVFYNEPIYEVYHAFTGDTSKCYSSTLSTPILVSGVHRPTFDKPSWDILNSRVKYFEGFLTGNEGNDGQKFETLLRIFEELVHDDENIRYKIDQAIEEGKIDYAKYKQVIREKFPNIREVQIKNKIGAEIVSFYHLFSKINQPLLKDSIRVRPVPGIDSPNLVEYDILSVMVEHQSILHQACVSSIKIQRPINYTCPVKTCVIFMHNQPVAQHLNDPDWVTLLEGFNKVHSLQHLHQMQADIDHSLTHEQTLKIKSVHPISCDTPSSYRWAEFDCSSSSKYRDPGVLRPVAWVSFEDPTQRELVLNLSRPVSTRFVSVKFINVHNLSQEVNNNFDPTTNVDVASIQFIGHNIPSHVFQ